MQVDPHAWLFTTPLTIAFIQAYFLPADHVIRRIWRHVGQMESLAWERLGWSGHPLQLSRAGLLPRVTFFVLCAALAVTSLASFASFLQAA